MSKYNKTKPRLHVEVIKAWADGSKIEFESPVNGWVCIDDPSWSDDTSYRIAPCCSYVIDKILEQSESEEVCTTYKNWLAGQTTVVTTPASSAKIELSDAEYTDDPFRLFMTHLKQGCKVENCKVQNVDKKTKQVLIVYCHSVDSADSPAVRLWHDTRREIPTDWYEVPSMTLLNTDCGDFKSFVVGVRVTSDKNEYNQHRNLTLKEAREIQPLIHAVIDSYLKTKGK